MNIDTAGIEQLRDELARLMGYTRHEPPGGGDPYWTHESSRDAIYVHPIDLTLDFIAGAMKETGWVWWRKPRGDGQLLWFARCGTPGYGQVELTVPDTGDEIADRLRLVVKVRSRA